MVPVLMYHAVGTAVDPRFNRWVTPPDLLAAHLEAIRASGHRVVGVTEYLATGEPQDCVIATFDDGYADFRELALPILAATGSSATVYVVTGCIGRSAEWLPFPDERSRPIMTWSDIKAVRDAGVEVGGHSHRHRELDVLPAAAVERDVRLCRDALLRHDIKPLSFCYPFGYASDAVCGVVARVGFRTGCVVGRGLANFGQDALRVRRIEVSGRMTPDLLLARLSGPEMKSADRLREACQPLWRGFRRGRQMVKAKVDT